MKAFSQFVREAYAFKQFTLEANGDQAAAPQTLTPAPPKPTKRFDIRDRDPSARGGFDPRFDKKPVSQMLQAKEPYQPARPPVSVMRTPTPSNSTTTPASPTPQSNQKPQGVTNTPTPQPIAQSTGPKPGSAEDEEDIKNYYSNLPGFKYRKQIPIKPSKVAPGYYTKGGKIYFDKSAVK